MLRRSILVSALLGLAAFTAWAGDEMGKAGMDQSDHMKAMMTEMMSCSICKHMAPRMAELGPVMKMDVAPLNDGVAIMHSVTDPTKLEMFMAVGAEMHKAGEACMAMPEEQAKAELCGYCEEIYGVVHAGAKMSVGHTKVGDIMVFTSTDPAVQERIAVMATKCQVMAEMM